MNDLPPLTQELKDHITAILAMLNDTIGVITDYTRKHPGKLHHLSEETAHMCRVLSMHWGYLLDTGGSYYHHDCGAILQRVHEDADALDSMANQLHHHGGDDRLGNLLHLVAETSRFCDPAILRWCHGYKGNVPPSSVTPYIERFAKALKPVAHAFETV